MKIQEWIVLNNIVRPPDIRFNTDGVIKCCRGTIRDHGHGIMSTIVKYPRYVFVDDVTLMVTEIEVGYYSLN